MTTTTTPTSLGQLGYEAYAKHTGHVSLATGQPLPPWHELSPAIQSAWQAASLAIEHYIRKELQYLRSLSTF